MGRELGPNALDNYLENKTVIVRRAAGTIPWFNLQLFKLILNKK